MSKRKANQPATRHRADSERGGMSRRAWIGIAFGGAATALVGERWWRYSNPRVIAASETPMTVYASPSCGCCHKWVGHLEQSGFHVTVESVSDVTPIKSKLGVPKDLWSCHSGMVEGYAIEGHVPADLIQRLLAERPNIAGIATPGMPNGAPGMEGATTDRYEVIAFTRSGETSVYATR